MFTVQVNLCRESPLHDDCQQRVASLFPFMFYCSGQRVSSVPTLRGLSLSKGSPVCFHSCFTVQVNVYRESSPYGDCQDGDKVLTAAGIKYSRTVSESTTVVPVLPMIIIRPEMTQYSRQNSTLTSSWFLPTFFLYDFQ